jgi:hypothetical protein
MPYQINKLKSGVVSLSIVPDGLCAACNLLCLNVCVCWKIAEETLGVEMGILIDRPPIQSELTEQ